MGIGGKRKVCTVNGDAGGVRKFAKFRMIEFGIRKRAEINSWESFPPLPCAKVIVFPVMFFSFDASFMRSRAHHTVINNHI